MPSCPSLWGQRAALTRTRKANKTMNDKKYNGWTNYETWNVKLWIDNEEGSQNYWQEQAQEAYERADEDTLTKKENAATDLAERLKDQHQEAMNEWTPNQACVFTDLLGAALSEVNWYEIAESMIEDAIE